jgi:hypothetical protein
MRVIEAVARRMSRAPIGGSPFELFAWLEAQGGSQQGEVFASSGATLTPFYDVDWTTVRGWSIDAITVVPVLVLYARRMGKAVRFDPTVRPLIREASVVSPSHKTRQIEIEVNIGSPDAGAFVENPGSFLPLFESKFLHELTHARDWIRDRNVVDPREHLRSYYNSPHEVRAFLQQILAETLRQAVVQQAQRVALTSRTPNARLIDEALSHSKTWDKIHAHLNADSERRIRKTVAQAFRERELLYEEPKGSRAKLPRDR